MVTLANVDQFGNFEALSPSPTTLPEPANLAYRFGGNYIGLWLAKPAPVRDIDYHALDIATNLFGVRA